MISIDVLIGIYLGGVVLNWVLIALTADKKRDILWPSLGMSLFWPIATTVCFCMMVYEDRWR